MRAPKLIEHMRTNAERMSENALQLVRNSDRCRELVLKVPVEEQKRYSLAIYRDLMEWLADPSDGSLEQRYIALGIRRAQQGVPFNNLFWAVCIAHEHLWEYMQQECLLDEPVEFWGGVMLLRSLTQFFDRALYSVSLGYQKVEKGEAAADLAVA